MIRKTLTIFSLIGLLLSVGLWGVGSFYSLGYVSESYTFGVEDGSVIIGAYSQGSLPAHDFGFRWGKRTARFGIEMPRYFNLRPVGGVSALKLPLWIPTVVLAIGSISFVLIPRHRRRKRKKLGLCVNCGYDLRASKDRCPECGIGFSNQGTTQSP